MRCLPSFIFPVLLFAPFGLIGYGKACKYDSGNGQQNETAGMFHFNCHQELIVELRRPERRQRQVCITRIRSAVC